MRYEIYIPGDPQGKGRPRFTRGGRAYTPERTKDYEAKLREAWFAEGYPELAFPAGIPLKLTVECRFKIPVSASRKKQLMMLEGRIPCCKKPDLDNCIKVVDALKGVAFQDDSQIVLIKASKRWSTAGYMCVTIEDYAL